MYDLIVAGGGFSGVCAAVSAARRGLRVLLVEKSGYLGGAACNCYVNPFMRYTHTGEGERKKRISDGLFGEILAGLDVLGGLHENRMAFNEEILKLLLDRMTAEAGVEVLFHSYVMGAHTENRRIRKISLCTKSGILEKEAEAFVDATGDGDLAAIGTAETVHSATRGENITIIFINNAIYGMTGGQMAPTTLLGQVTTTSPYGRDAKVQGNPVHVCEMLSTLDGTTYAERVAVDCPKNVMAAKKAIKKAFQNQIDKKGFSIVEVLSTCPTNWGLAPTEALTWLRENMMPFYPLGVYKDKSKEEK